MRFSEAVKNAMDKTGNKTADVARATGYSYQHIKDLLSGDRRWNEDSIGKVCNVLGMELSFKMPPKREVEENDRHPQDTPPNSGHHSNEY